MLLLENIHNQLMGNSAVKQQVICLVPKKEFQILVK